MYFLSYKITIKDKNWKIIQPAIKEILKLLVNRQKRHNNRIKS